MAGQLVVRRGQPLPCRAKLGLRQGGLRMLNAYPDGEGLGGHGHSGVQQHLESVAGGVSGGEHQRVAGQVVPAAGTVHRNGPQGAVPHVQARQPVPEAHVAPQGQQLPPHIAHHVPENVGADVGLVLVEDVRRGARLHQRPEDRGDAGIVGAGGQLAVGEGARAPLADLHIGGGVQHPRGPEALHVRRPLLHRTAPLQHNGDDPVPG